FSDPFDSSSFDSAAGFAYSFDFENDGVFEITDVTSTSAIVPASYFADGPASRVVRGRIKDNDGSFTDYLCVIASANVSPTADFSSSGTVSEGSSAVVSFGNPSDPSSADMAAGFRYSFDFNND